MPPANDDFASATLVSFPFSVTGSNIGSTVESGEPVPGTMATTVWYRFVLAGISHIIVDLAGSDFNTTMCIYDSAGSAKAYNDDSNGPQSRIEAILAAGEYHVQVGGRLGATGNIVMSGQIVDGGDGDSPSNSLRSRQVRFE